MNIPRFQEPEAEETQIPEDKFYCVHCFQDKPESSMSIIDDCCQVCLAKAFDRFDAWDNMLDTIRKWVEEGLSYKEDKVIVLSKIQAYLKGR